MTVGFLVIKPCSYSFTFTLIFPLTSFQPPVVSKAAWMSCWTSKLRNLALRTIPWELSLAACVRFLADGFTVAVSHNSHLYPHSPTLCSPHQIQNITKNFALGDWTHRLCWWPLGLCWPPSPQKGCFCSGVCDRLRAAQGSRKINHDVENVSTPRKTDKTPCLIHFYLGRVHVESFCLLEHQNIRPGPSTVHPRWSSPLKEWGLQEGEWAAINNPCVLTSHPRASTPPQAYKSHLESLPLIVRSIWSTWLPDKPSDRSVCV